MSYDVALTQEQDGTTLAHRIDCLAVEQARVAGKPIFTMFQCDGPIPSDIKRHTCMAASEAR